MIATQRGSRIHSLAWLRAAAIAAALAMCGGCSDGPRLGSVEGIVTLDGRPVTNGKVLFQPAAGRGAEGIIQSDGSFAMATDGEGAGAHLGLHKVAIVAYEQGSSGRPEPGGPRTTLKPLVPERYLAPGTSGLTYEVKPGENRAEFALTSP